MTNRVMCWDDDVFQEVNDSLLLSMICKKLNKKSIKLFEALISKINYRKDIL